jgi:hypothetical protein
MPMMRDGYAGRLDFGRRLEPVGDRVIHGAGQDPDSFRAYWRAMGRGREPALYMSYTPLKADMRAYFEGLSRELDEYSPLRVVPQIGLHFNGGALEGKAEPHYEHEVAEGHLDVQIGAFCAGLRSLDRPAYVRIGFEFNGPWNGYEPEPYKAAWVRLVTALRSYGLEDVAAVWCYCPLPSDREEPGVGRIDRDYLQYYPGDEWVDWWSIDLFSPEMFELDNTRWFMEDARAAGYPVMIGESTPRWVGGVERGEAAWDAWYAPYFRFIRDHRIVKAFCYINWDWDRYPEFQGWGDARIQENELILERYRREIGDALFVHATAGGR